MIEFPLAIILTHRRGAAIGIIKDPSFFDSIFLLSRNEILSIPLMPIIKKDNFEILYYETQIFLRVIGKTAENLLSTYLAALKYAHLSSNEIKTFAVGTGPGSFTGLRLGCAFVNGIKFGQGGMLLSVQSELVNTFFSIFFDDLQKTEEFKRQLDEYNIEDDSTGFVTFFDIFDSLYKINLFYSKNSRTLSMAAQVVNIFEPHYGKEPGPVLKLKGLNNGS